MEYTIFARWNDHGHRQGKDCFFPPLSGEPKSLADRIEYVRNFYGEDSFLPVAWGPGSISFDDLDAEFAEALAAGRLIEKTASGWVALGAEKQEAPCMELSVAVGVIAETPEFAGDGYWADAEMIARDNTDAAFRYARKRAFIANVAQMAANRAPQSTAKPNPFPTTLRSPDCDSGPSDHLNASRHQMAAKQFDKA